MTKENAKLMSADDAPPAAPPSTVREKRSTRTKSALYDALLSLLEERPFEQITIRDITATAKVGYATFFRHYSDKAELLHDVAASEIRQLLAMTLPLLYTVDSLASTQALCAYLWENRKLWSALLTGGAAATLKDEFVQQAQHAAEQQNPANGLPGNLSVVFSVAATIEILAWWLKQSDPPPVGRMAEILDQLVVTPTWRGKSRKG